MSILDKVNWLLLIVWAILMMSVFIKVRRVSQKPQFFSLYASNIGVATYFSMLRLARHHGYVSIWWDTLGVVIGIGWQLYWLWRIWRDNTKNREKAIAEGRISAVYNDRAKLDPP